MGLATELAGHRHQSAYGQVSVSLFHTLQVRHGDPEDLGEVRLSPPSRDPFLGDPTADLAHDARHMTRCGFDGAH
jgi:hypothetical protein